MINMNTEELVTIKLTKSEADALVNILLKVKKVHDGGKKVKRCKD
jgi:hypothetical protein